MCWMRPVKKRLVHQWVWSFMLPPHLPMYMLLHLTANMFSTILSFLCTLSCAYGTHTRTHTHAHTHTHHMCVSYMHAHRLTLTHIYIPSSWLSPSPTCCPCCTTILPSFTSLTRECHSSPGSSPHGRASLECSSLVSRYHMVNCDTK